MSAFALEDGVVYHTDSTYAGGLDVLWGMYQCLDRTPEGATRRASGGAATRSLTWPNYRPPSVKTVDKGPHPTALCACTVTDQFGV